MMNSQKAFDAGYTQALMSLDAWMRVALARLVMGLDPYAISDDEVGAPDFEHRGVKYDVKSITADYPILNVQHYEGVLERKRDWVIMVMMYEGMGWRFIHAKDILYNNLAYIEPIAATGGHRSTHWRLDLGTK
jgi:hypothetical protein